ncbi:MAG: YhbY family RNA-binding protein [Alphaproteobacteria bacterium]
MAENGSEEARDSRKGRAERPPAPSLTGAQRQSLRGQAHALRPVVQVGHEGVTEAVLDAVDDALAAHELVKVRLHAPLDKRADAGALAEGARAALCGVVGHTVILWRPREERPSIVP